MKGTAVATDVWAEKMRRWDDSLSEGFAARDAEIVRRRESGETLPQISKAMGIGRNRVADILAIQAARVECPALEKYGNHHALAYHQLRKLGFRIYPPSD